MSREPLTPAQRKLFDDYLAEWGSPLRILRHTRGKMLRLALSLGMEMEDLEQEALMVLAESARYFDPDNAAGATFETYANSRMVSAISRPIYHATRPKRNPANGGIISGSREVFNKHGRGRQLFEFIGKLDREPDFDLREIINDALRFLSARERQVANLRFGLDGTRPKTMVATGSLMGISRGRVEQIERRVTEKLWLRLRQFDLTGAI